MIPPLPGATTAHGLHGHFAEWWIWRGSRCRRRTGPKNAEDLESVNQMQWFLTGRSHVCPITLASEHSAIFKNSAIIFVKLRSFYHFRRRRSILSFSLLMFICHSNRDRRCFTW